MLRAQVIEFIVLRVCKMYAVSHTDLYNSCRSPRVSNARTLILGLMLHSGAFESVRDCRKAFAMKVKSSTYNSFKRRLNSDVEYRSRYNYIKAELDAISIP